MKETIASLLILLASSLFAQNEGSGFKSLHRKVSGEAVGNNEGVMVDRPFSEMEYSEVTIVFNHEMDVSSIALNRIDGIIELIVLTGDDFGALSGAYSSFRGDIHINFKVFDTEGQRVAMLNLVKERKIIVGIFFDL